VIELDDCGRELHLSNTSPYRDDMNVTVIMVIRAPRGTMALFDQNYISPDTQCEAIRAFMEEHTPIKQGRLL